MMTQVTPPGFESAIDDASSAPPRNAHDSSVLWSDQRLVGFAPMDRTHEEFYSIVFALLTCNDASAAAAMQAFEEHAQQHFGEEEQWMIETAFPPRQCHADEHAAVMASVKSVRQALADGQADATTVRDLAAHLFQWFPGHADYMDASLATWMVKQHYGGTPVVLRRATR